MYYFGFRVKGLGDFSKQPYLRLRNKGEKRETSTYYLGLGGLEVWGFIGFVKAALGTFNRDYM